MRRGSACHASPSTGMARLRLACSGVVGRSPAGWGRVRFGSGEKSPARSARAWPVPLLPGKVSRASASYARVRFVSGTEGWRSAGRAAWLGRPSLRRAGYSMVGLCSVRTCRGTLVLDAARIATGMEREGGARARRAPAWPQLPCDLLGFGALSPVGAGSATPRCRSLRTGLECCAMSPVSLGKR